MSTFLYLITLIILLTIGVREVVQMAIALDAGSVHKLFAHTFYALGTIFFCILISRIATDISKKKEDEK